jgi:hypothetical protein
VLASDTLIEELEGENIFTVGEEFLFQEFHEILMIVMLKHFFDFSISLLIFLQKFLV